MTDASLASFETALAAFLTDYEHATWHTPLVEFSSATPGNQNSSPGKLLGGQAPFSDAVQLSSSFTTWAKALSGNLDTMRTQFQKLTTKLQNAKGILQNGESQALSAAQMMEVLGPVLSAVPTSGGITTGA